VYFYNQLTTPAKKFYKLIVNNISVMKNGNSVIYIDDAEFADVFKEDNGTDILKEEYQKAWDALKMDRTDLFFVDSTKVILTISKKEIINRVERTISLEPNESGSYYAAGFNSREEVEEAEKKLETIRSNECKILSGNVIQDITDVNDFIVDIVTYTADTEKEQVATVYGALVNREATCEGYAKAFKYFMDYLGIKNVLVTGTARDTSGNEEPHMWNYVCLNDKWYGVDVTWDDPVIIGSSRDLTSEEKHEYLLKKASKFNLRHTTDGHIVDNGYEFSYPSLEN